MRAANQPQSSTAIESNRVLHPVHRVFVVVLATLALLIVWRPAVVHGHEVNPGLVTVSDATVDQAKDEATVTHVVRAGETLWGLAARYYGDGHQWPALARRNRIATTGPAPLRVGMKLTVPASPVVRGAKAAVVAAAPADSSVPSVALAKAGQGTLPSPLPAPPAGSLSAQTAGKPNATASGVTAASRPSAKAPKVATVTAIDTGPGLAVEPADAETSRMSFQQPRGSELLVVRKVQAIGLGDLDAQEASRKDSEVQTVFHRDMPDAAEAERRTRASLRPNAPAPRQAEYDAAPFVLLPSALAKAGSLTKRVGSPVTTESGYPQRAILTDQVEVRPPAGMTYAVGQRLVAVTTIASTDKRSMIAIPAGIVEVVRVERGKPVLAVLMRQSGRVEQGQRLLPVTGAPAPWLKAQPLEEPDVRTGVRWVDPNELQPTLQSFLLLGAGSVQGVKAGDEFGLYRNGSKAEPAQESLVATVRVVRSEATGSAAVIMRQYQSDITVGLEARRLAKAP